MGQRLFRVQEILLTGQVHLFRRRDRTFNPVAQIPVMLRKGTGRNDFGNRSRRLVRQCGTVHNKHVKTRHLPIINNRKILGQVVERGAGWWVPLDRLMTNRGDDMSFEGIAGLAVKDVEGLRAGHHVVRLFPSAVGRVKRVITDPGWGISAIALRSLLNENLTAFLPSAEGVGSIAHADDGILTRNLVVPLCSLM